MIERPFNTLFLCTGNSARSIIAEAILNKIGKGKFQAYSAGSQPKGQVNPNTLQLLRDLGYDTSGFRSKSWSEFAKPGAPPLDFVFTVCDNAAGEACPVWPGQPMTAHWGVPDPAEATGSEAEIALAFKDAYRMLQRRIEIFVALPIRSLDKLSLQAKLKDIGQMEGATATPKSRLDGAARAPGRRRGAGHGVSARRRGRLRHHGAAARRRKRRARAARQHVADRGDPRGADPDLRPDFRRPFQSGRQHRLRAARELPWGDAAGPMSRARAAAASSAYGPRI